jgi:hypothetical protein
MVRFPQLHLSVVVLFNHFLWEMQDYALKVADLFLEEKASPVVVEQQAPQEVAVAPIQLSVEQLQNKAGTYYSAPRAALREITCVKGTLQFQGLALVPLNENFFFFEVEPKTNVEFILGEDDAVAGMKTITSSGEYRYDRVETVAPTSEELAAYAGRYYSPELDIYWTIEANKDHLTAKRRKYVDSKLTPLFRDAFSDDWGPLMGYPTTYMVVFERDEHEAIIGLRVSGTRVRHLKFVKE